MLRLPLAAAEERGSESHVCSFLWAHVTCPNPCHVARFANAAATKPDHLKLLYFNEWISWALHVVTNYHVSCITEKKKTEAKVWNHDCHPEYYPFNLWGHVVCTQLYEKCHIMQTKLILWHNKQQQNKATKNHVFFLQGWLTSFFHLSPSVPDEWSNRCSCCSKPASWNPWWKYPEKEPKKTKQNNNNKLINQHFILINADEIRHSNKAMSKSLPHTATSVFLPACL